MVETPKILVIGGGPAGLKAAGDLLDVGFSVVLVEKRAELGGAPIRWNYSSLAPDLRPVEEVMNPLIHKVVSSPKVKTYREAEVEQFSGSSGNFSVSIKSKHENSKEENISSIIVATGFEHFNASVDPRYSYGRAPNVIAINELEGMLKQKKLVGHDGKEPKRIAFIFCVGSRDKATNAYCCSVCCGISIKQAMEIKDLIKEAQLYMIYMDIRTTGQWEKLYWKSMEDYGINYIRGRVAEVFPINGKLLVKGEDTLVRGPFEVLFDMVVLAVGMEPSPGTKSMAKLLGLKLNQYGFIEPKHPNYLVESGIAGIYLAGTCVTPMSLEESLSQGSAAAMQAVKNAMQRLVKPIEV